jgi:proline iminopeptidase
MKKLLTIIPLVFLLCFTFSCQQGEEVAEDSKEEATFGVVSVDGFDLAYSIEGTGIPCAAVGDALSISRGTSKALREYFKFIFIDSRMTTPTKEGFDISTITFDTLVDDIEMVRKTLGIEKFCVFGHSISGLLALEYARKYPEHTSHVIMNGTPPFFNEDFVAMGIEYWESNASDDRKAILKQNMERLTPEKISSLTQSEAEITSYVSEGPKIFFDQTYDCSWIFKGGFWNIEVWDHLFDVIMADYDLAEGRAVTTPIFLALGRYDYLVPVHVWDSEKGKLPTVSLNLFEKSGHWAFLEEHDLFDKKLIDWIKSN